MIMQSPGVFLIMCSKFMGLLVRRPGSPRRAVNYGFSCSCGCFPRVYNPAFCLYSKKPQVHPGPGQKAFHTGASISILYDLAGSMHHRAHHAQLTSICQRSQACPHQWLNPKMPLLIPTLSFLQPRACRKFEQSFKDSYPPATRRDSARKTELWQAHTKIFYVRGSRSPDGKGSQSRSQVFYHPCRNIFPGHVFLQGENKARSLCRGFTHCAQRDRTQILPKQASEF